MSPERFLIDTTVWVKYLRGMDLSMKDRISALVLEDKAMTSEIIVLEILRGARSGREYRMLYEDFLALPVLNMDRAVWETAWETAYKLRKKGINVPMADVMISAIAIHYKCTLMHCDKHFTLVSKHTGLKAVGT